MKKIIVVLAFVFGIAFSNSSFAATSNNINLTKNQTVLTEKVVENTQSVKVLKVDKVSKVEKLKITFSVEKDKDGKPVLVIRISL